MCKEHSMAGKGPIMETMMSETWELLTTEQKKEAAVMRMNKLIKILEMKISGLQQMIEIKKEAIANMQKIMEMLK
jgi:hypothetical protein